MLTLLAASLAVAQLSQYPDVSLYNAAARLRPEHRPTVPVRLYTDPGPVYALWGSPPNPDASAVVGPKNDVIFVNATKSSYRDLDRLAAVLAHEQRHVEGGSEFDAQLREYQVLKALSSRWKSNPRLKQLEAAYGGQLVRAAK